MAPQGCATHLVIGESIPGAILALPVDHERPGAICGMIFPRIAEGAFSIREGGIKDGLVARSYAHHASAGRAELIEPVKHIIVGAAVRGNEDARLILRGPSGIDELKFQPATVKDARAGSTVARRLAAQLPSHIPQANQLVEEDVVV